ncbi:NAD-dependent epimerase/dehydratase OS=Tsukamurella paurometabola (strain ATCC 8368 / DSM /CCUG 35730 / CIP 100753 / JCM 10117 / KCTC 9821 / NBRC 16120/ NCIMB 702349 / NCTC 13040) OX=521096 GN=Tpau_0204 PE=4 SV=1 [Tsukamurella paurometabola]|uniref:NAD-dependent epimerase/dehydratase n=1 Tax=Tsukamurella paurometabola (strain ATCC 8368 / DSM 20162 / CCUG 35730 / CIP 100753 / JCM 10117 / KCTC 9821 / NBRC 16120 / NCIMB 702349 / NCTC 13040) TaxID=521096 RepID=D5UQM5_TSUPD|nr:SDR family oxidoreductase [Tsukamurella paurometabola]ADG76858.1 NAD-dependent epimerase/dehydratase [Tsukamurella paurometabola DSM 20162]SUP41946.1 Putative NADH-flavin reductase [Tsukamurella paurometabola]
MRYLVTGASGFVGTAVTAELIAAGHEVRGLVRSDRAAEAIRSLGAEPVLGTIEDTDLLRAAAAASDGVVHLAFNHDFSRFEESARVERGAIEAFGTALEGSDRPLAIASGVAGLTSGRTAVESDRPAPGSPRSGNADAALALADRGVRATVVRLAPSVHDASPAGFVAHLVETARATGSSGYVGDGEQRWAAVHRADAARLFRLAVERGRAGEVYHAVGEEGVPTRAIAEAVAALTGVDVAPVPDAEAAHRFGFLAGILALDSPASNAWTRERFGWNPTGPGLLADIAAWPGA